MVKPLAPTRYKIQFTASAELHDKLARLRALMRSSVPDGDLAAIIEEAVTEKLERLESRRFGKTNVPRKSLEHTDTSPSSRHIAATVKRTVSKRDGNRCSFVDAHGKRCSERHGLEFHHDQPFGRGGDHSPENVHMMCPAHNAYLAERDYGKEVMERCRRLNTSGLATTFNDGRNQAGLTRDKTNPTPAPQLGPDRVARRSGSRAREPAPVYASATP